MNTGDSFGCGDQTHKTKIACACVAQLLNRGDRRARSSQHRVNSNGDTISQSFGNVRVVLDRFESFMVSVHTDEPNRCRRNDVKKAVEQTIPCPENRYECRICLQLLAFGRAKWCFNGDRRGRQIIQRFVGKQCRGLAEKLAKERCRCAYISHQRQLVLHQRMVNSDKT